MRIEQSYTKIYADNNTVDLIKIVTKLHIVQLLTSYSDLHNH